MLALHKHLLALRRDAIVPHLHGMQGDAGSFALLSPGILSAIWRLGDGSRLALLANLGDAPAQAAPPLGKPLFLSEHLAEAGLAAGALPPWSVAWTIEQGTAAP